MFEATGLQELSEQECLRLLGTTSVGRIVFTEHALPSILPVNFVLCDNAIVLRTAENSSLAKAVEGTVVAFEADHFTTPDRDSWSVVVHGRAQALLDPRARRAADELGLRPWAPGLRTHYLRIGIELVSGRRRGR